MHYIQLCSCIYSHAVSLSKSYSYLYLLYDVQVRAQYHKEMSQGVILLLIAVV